MVAGAMPAEADSARHQAGLGAERQDQLLLGLLLLGLHPFPQRGTVPKQNASAVSEVQGQWMIPPPAPKARQN